MAFHPTRPVTWVLNELDNTVTTYRWDGKKGALRALVLEDGTRIEVGFALVSLGLFRVYNELAREADLSIGERGGVLIDDELRTGFPEVLSNEIAELGGANAVCLERSR